MHSITLRRWIKSGKIQAVRLGIETRIPWGEIERFVGKVDDRLLVQYAWVSRYDQRLNLLRQIERRESMGQGGATNAGVAFALGNWLWLECGTQTLAAASQTRVWAAWQRWR